MVNIAKVETLDSIPKRNILIKIGLPFRATFKKTDGSLRQGIFKPLTLNEHNDKSTENLLVIDLELLEYRTIILSSLISIEIIV